MRTPWVSMWTDPRSTIRSIVQSNPKYGFWVLSTLYALVSCFYFSNYFSLGLSGSFSVIFVPLILLSPLIGFVWLSFDAWILHWVGLRLKGRAPYQHVRSAVAWAKLPYIFSLGMWVILMVFNPDTAFIQYVTGVSALFITFITFILNTWAVILLIQAVREVQSFSLLRSISNVFFGWIVSSFLSLIVLIIGRYIYLMSI